MPLPTPCVASEVTNEVVQAGLPDVVSGRSENLSCWWSWCPLSDSVTSFQLRRLLGLSLLAKVRSYPPSEMEETTKDADKGPPAVEASGVVRSPRLTSFLHDFQRTVNQLSSSPIVGQNEWFGWLQISVLGLFFFHFSVIYGTCVTRVNCLLQQVLWLVQLAFRGQMTKGKLVLRLVCNCYALTTIVIYVCCICLAWCVVM